MAGATSLEAVRRKIRSLQEQTDAAEGRSQRLQQELLAEGKVREQVSTLGTPSSSSVRRWIHFWRTSDSRYSSASRSGFDVLQFVISLLRNPASFTSGGHVTLLPSLQKKKSNCFTSSENV